MTIELLIERASVVLLALWVVVRARGAMRGQTAGAGGGLARAAFAAAVLAVVLNYPFGILGGLSLAGLFLSFDTTVSAGLIIMAAMGIARQLTGARLLSGAAASALAAWNVATGLVLYAGLIGCIPVDVYSAGFGPSWFFALLFVITIALVIHGSALKWVFIIYICAWVLGLLPSANIFDYIVDPLLVMVSAVLLARQGLKRAVSH